VSRVYGGSNLLWRTRGVRRRTRRPLVWARHRRIAPDDIGLVSYPRSGSTWFSFMMSELILGHDPSFTDAHSAVPEIPDISPHTPRLHSGGRMFRSHEPYRSCYRKAIYVARDPRDVVVSYFKYRRWLREYQGTLSEFVEMFLEGSVDSYGRWADHVESWLFRAGEEVLVVRYEDLLRDPATSLRTSAGFLGMSATDDAIGAAVANNDMGRMRDKEEGVRTEVFGRADPTGAFVRAGRSQGWEASLSVAAEEAVVAQNRRVMAMLGYVE
jgi:hypothetical protein